MGWQSNEPTPVTQAPRPTKKSRRVHPLLWFIIVPGLAGLAFLALGFFLVAIGWEAEPETAFGVQGVELERERVGSNGGTTWFTIVEEDTTDAEVTRIATELVAAPEVEPLLAEGLDILIFNDGGRKLRNLMDGMEELDEASVENDFAKIIEIGLELDEPWLAEHGIAAARAETAEDGSPAYTLCLGAAIGCEDDKAITPTR